MLPWFEDSVDIFVHIDINNFNAALNQLWLDFVACKMRSDPYEKLSMVKMAATD